MFDNIYCFVGVQNGKVEQPMWTRTANGANKKLVLHCNSGVAGYQSEQQCHISRMNSIFEVNRIGKWAWQLSINFFVIYEVMNGCTILKIH